MSPPAEMRGRWGEGGGRARSGSEGSCRRSWRSAGWAGAVINKWDYWQCETRSDWAWAERRRLLLISPEVCTKPFLLLDLIHLRPQTCSATSPPDCLPPTRPPQRVAARGPSSPLRSAATSPSPRSAESARAKQQLRPSRAFPASAIPWFGSRCHERAQHAARCTAAPPAIDLSPRRPVSSRPLQYTHSSFADSTLAAAR